MTSIFINKEKTILIKANIKNLVNQTLLSKGRIQTIKVIEIIDQYREAQTAIDITYVKEITTEVVYNKVEVKEIKNNFIKIDEVAYNKVDIVNIVEPKIQNIKWLTAKGFITN